MNYHDYKQAQRQHCKPIITQRESIGTWLLPVMIGVGLAAALVAWWAS